MSEIDPALANAIRHIEHILGPREHPDVAAIIDVVDDALTAQRRSIARQARIEASAYQRGQMPKSGNQQLTYDGGLRRAARIAEGAPSAEMGPREHRFRGDVMSAPHDEPQY